MTRTNREVYTILCLAIQHAKAGYNVTWGVSRLSVTRVGGWLLQCWGLYYALHCMLMACPNQDGTQQGQHGGSRDDPADNDLGIGSGWRQNKQN